MEIVTLILTAIKGLTVISGNRAINDGRGARLDEISELLGMLAALVQTGSATYAELKAFTEVIELMAAEGRMPTPTEWAGLRSRSDTAHATLQEAKKEILADEVAEIEDEIATDEELGSELPPIG